MKKHITEYIFKMYERDSLAKADVSYVLDLALKDGVTELHLNKHHYDTIVSYMTYCGAWNWDKKTFMGITLTVDTIN